MINAECFTGRTGRVVNWLNGLSLLVNIKDSDQIDNIIVLIKNTHNYDVETHK